MTFLTADHPFTIQYWRLSVASVSWTPPWRVLWCASRIINLVKWQPAGRITGCLASSSRREWERRPPTLSKWFCIMGFNGKRVLFVESLPFVCNCWSSSLKYAVWTRYIRQSLVFSILLALISSEVGVWWHSKDWRTVKKVTTGLEVSLILNFRADSLDESEAIRSHSI